MAADNKMLGNIDLVGIPPAPRGVPQIEVTFDIDANGIVNVSAKDRATGKEQQITIQSSGGMTEEQIQQMVNDAETFAAKDKERKEVIEARNDADTLIYSTEKSLNEHKSKLPADVVTGIEDALKGLRAEMESENLETLKSKTDDLRKAAMKIGESLQQQAGSAQGSESEAKEAEYEDVETKDKDKKD